MSTGRVPGGSDWRSFRAFSESFTVNVYKYCQAIQVHKTIENEMRAQRADLHGGGARAEEPPMRGPCPQLVSRPRCIPGSI